MNVNEINSFLLNAPATQGPLLSLFPNLKAKDTAPFSFKIDFGLDTLPTAPGVILIRGARQLGKSTWIEEQVLANYREHGPGTTFYLNGDYIRDKEDLESQIVEILALIKNSGVAAKLFIDEITAISEWELVLKRLYDSGKTRDILIVTTGSQAQDLRHGTERLPGRKGKLLRNDFYFTPVSYKEFYKKTKRVFGENTLHAYLMTGGSPLAANELARSGTIPEFVYALTLEWLLGECARAGRSRNILQWLVQTLWKVGPNPVSVNQLAQEAGVANNTVIQGYIDLLMDCLALGIAQQMNIKTWRPIPRKAAKYPWINMLAAWCFFPGRPSTFADASTLPEFVQGYAWECLVGQELWRRAAVRGVTTPEYMGTFEDRDHAIDYTNKSGHLLVEVKSGKTNPREFAWFSQVFKKSELIVVSKSTFKLSGVTGMTFHDFLMME
jgi:uncharacterized protein